MQTSIFEIFKIGIGPSSSHTVGPMRAARDFALTLRQDGTLDRIQRVQTDLFGSLALTGKGHGTDRAIMLGLMGEAPDSIDPASIDKKLAAISSTQTLSLLGEHSIAFRSDTDIVFRKTETLSARSNGMRFTAVDSSGNTLGTQIYYSIGGGFIKKEGEATSAQAKAPVPHPFSNSAELLRIGEEKNLAIWQIALENEKAWHTEDQIRAHVEGVWQTMEDCMDRGLVTEGVLPGGLNVKRRAPRLARKLETQGNADSLAPLDWVNAYAMAVNEENAAGGRVVTAPTNGAAGIIPAVGRYYRIFISDADPEGIFRYLLTASTIGILYKENASISGAEVGCQGEVGVACSMAAGGLVAALSGDNRQIEYAAEIGMEHNLGMTCDPIGGLVQIPCIERNAMGSVKAINACRIAMRETGEHKVSLDQVIETMYQTGLDMQSRYKETSLAGLALNVIEC